MTSSRGSSLAQLRKAIRIAVTNAGDKSATPLLTRHLGMARWYIGGCGSFTDREMRKAVSHGLCEVVPETGQLRVLPD